MFFLFFFTDTATTEIYTLSLHDALPIFFSSSITFVTARSMPRLRSIGFAPDLKDRKSTRLNSSHSSISYAVFCLKKKKQIPSSTPTISKRRHQNRPSHSDSDGHIFDTTR